MFHVQTTTDFETEREGGRGMLIQKICAECGKTFSTGHSAAEYCCQNHQKRAYRRRRWADPAHRAKIQATQRASKARIKERQPMGRKEKQLIIDCYGAGWGGVQIMYLIEDVLGIKRSSKVIRSLITRELAPSLAGGGPSEQIPDYRKSNDAFLAAVRAAHPEIKEGIFRDNSPLVVKPISRPGIYGGSVAANVAELGSPRGSKW